jgi:import inner membrane translocase subunit TIM17
MAKARAPVLGYGVYDCAIKGFRKKEDPWNAIGACFVTSGSLAVRGGFKAARNNAMGCN